MSHYMLSSQACVPYHLQNMHARAGFYGSHHRARCTARCSEPGTLGGPGLVWLSFCSPLPGQDAAGIVPKVCLGRELTISEQACLSPSIASLA